MVELKCETENWLEKVILIQRAIESRDYLIAIFLKKLQKKRKLIQRQCKICFKHKNLLFNTCMHTFSKNLGAT